MNVPQKMPSGTSVLKSSKYINGIIDYLKENRLISDLKTIRLNSGKGGITISAINQRGGTSGEAAANYAGYFTAINSGTGKVKVINGADPASSVAGYVKLGNTRLPVAVAEFTVASAGRIWIYTKNTSGTVTAELRNGGTLPAEVRGEDIREIISYDSAAAITQIWQLGEYVITGKAG